MSERWRFKFLTTRSAPTVVFLVTAVAIVVVLFIRGGNQVSAIGYAAGDEIAVAPLTAGRVAQVMVRPGQQVAEGQVVVQLDTLAVDQAIAEARAELAQLEAERAATQTDGKRQTQLNARLYEESAESLSATLVDAREQVNEARAILEVLGPERERVGRLVDQQLATRDALAEVELRHAQATQELARRQAQVTVLESHMDANQRRLSANRSLGVPSAEAMDWAIAAVDLRVQRLLSEKRALSLRAPTAGRVTQIERRAGEVVSPGDPTLRLVSTDLSEAVACVKEADAMGITVGMQARVWPYGGADHSRTGEVISLGPVMAQLPARCPGTALIPARGREVTLLLDDPQGLVPGQTLHVRFGEMRHHDTPVAIAGEPSPMSVPPGLKEKSRFEPSAIAWSPQRARYIIGSDDTGAGGTDEHKPWLFTMTVDGRVDPEPLVVSGLEEISDIEGLAAGEGGDLWLLTSQSLSSKGKRPRARTLFARLSTQGGRVKADGAVSLAGALSDLSPAEREALGVSDLDALDIEGLTYHDGALYLGLKSPLAADGRALIWRMNTPRAFLATGKLSSAQLSLWGRAPLTALRDGIEVPGGVSELMFLPDGALLLASTPSQGDQGRPGGTLWLVASPRGGELDPHLVRTFDGRKPEGLSASPVPGRIAVVFDAGDSTPDWLEMPWPQL